MLGPPQPAKPSRPYRRQLPTDTVRHISTGTPTPSQKTGRRPVTSVIDPFSSGKCPSRPHPCVISQPRKQAWLTIIKRQVGRQVAMGAKYKAKV